MTDSLPDFEAPPTEPAEPAPKKARRKPSKRRSARSVKPAKEAKPPRAAKRRKKVDRRTKAFRQARIVHVDVTEAFKPKPVTGEAETVLAILDRLASYDIDVKKRILARVGQLA